MLDLRFRQIHLDFHNSEKIPSIGEDFDAKEFAQTLKKAHVNSVTCFAKCVHGMLYYDSKAFPELVHPGLKNKDLLKEQIAACHAQDIKVPVYTIAQWDDYASKHHPEWLCFTANGSIANYGSHDLTSMYEPGFARTLCVNSPYRDFLKDQITDMFDVIGPKNVDGIFIDIVNVVDCSCQHCVKGMLAEGYDPTIKEERLTYARNMIKEFKEDMSDFLRSFRSDLSIFYNCGHINHMSYEAKEAYSHFELESLPSGHWGYSHFMNTIRYARTTGLDCLAQTGKFHTDWGDFHSFKNQEALEYECFRMLALNSKCLIGDQLFPQGKLCEPVYDLIGNVYKQIEEKEPWCEKAHALTDLAVFTPECLSNAGSVPNSVVGCCQMLDELGMQFDIIIDKNNFNDYPLIILPDEVITDDKLAAKFESYVAQGGKLIASAKSGLNVEKTQFNLDCLGVNYKGEIPLFPDFIIPNNVIGSSLPPVEHVMYLRGENVAAKKGTEELLQTKVPFFNRTWQHFCSHQYTPSSQKDGTPAVFRNKNCIYFSHPLFSTYRKNHPKWCKIILQDAIKLIMPKTIVSHDGPSSLLVTVNEQKDQDRFILHALHYIPEKNSEDMYTIENVIPLYHVNLALHLPRKITKAKIVPECTEIPFSYDKDGSLHVELEKINGHLMVEFD